VFSPHDELKAVSLADLQDAIANAVSEKVGIKIICTIAQIEFESVHVVTATVHFRTPNIFDEAGDHGADGA